MSATPSYPAANSSEEIAQNLAAVRAQIVLACHQVGRPIETVRLLPVSKTVDEARLRLAWQAGCRELGENKVQEALRKWETFAAEPGVQEIQWAIIGHLQSNKAKYVARFASEFQALDSVRVAEELERRLQQAGRGLNVFVQVNTSGEASKYGLAPEQVAGFLRELPAFSALKVRGLMTLAALSADQQRVRGCFRLLRSLRDELRQTAPEGIDLAELSMGMSGDFAIAIEEGATIVRVGQAIFGSRATPDSYYWPGEESAEHKEKPL